MSARPAPTSTGSSPACATDLVADRKARRAVLILSWLLLLAGTSIIARLEVSVLVRIVVSAVWLALVGRDIACHARGQARIRTLRVTADGGCRGRARNGETYNLQILEGSIASQNVAWIRLRFDDGLIYAEPLRARRTEASAWRRLRILMRWAPFR